MISVADEYEFKACEISSFDFDIINTGSAEGTYAIHVTGAASQWMFMPKSVTIAGQGKESVQGYVKIPCDAQGSNEFTITATAAGEQTDSAQSVIKIKRVYGWEFGQLFKTPAGIQFWIGVLFLLLVLAIVLLLLYAEEIGAILFGKRRKKCGAESFGGCS